jgi:hypothetical protein
MKRGENHKPSEKARRRGEKARLRDEKPGIDLIVSIADV